MRKVTFKNSYGKNLSGIIHASKQNKDSIIIISHGSASNKDRERIVRLSSEYEKNGISVLRFDFGGSGDSYESNITIHGQVDDLKSAIKFAKSVGYSRIGLHGESLGGLVSILSYNPDIEAMVLLAPVTSNKIPNLLNNDTSRKELADKGYVSRIKDSRTFIFPAEYFAERNSINQRTILSSIKCPVLIIHGDADESVPLDQSIQGLKYLSKESRLEVINKGDHTLNSKLDEIIPISVNWFKKYLIN